MAKLWTICSSKLMFTTDVLPNFIKLLTVHVQVITHWNENEEHVDCVIHRRLRAY